MNVLKWLYGCVIESRRYETGMAHVRIVKDGIFLDFTSSASGGDGESECGLSRWAMYAT